MQHNRTLRVITAFLLLTAGIILFLILNVCIGTVSIPFKDILSSIRGQEVLNARILWDIRMPRTLAALILGGALALAGYLLQTFFHNPIAGPFVLGISSGAKMIVALFMVFFMGRSIRVTSFTMILAAFLGAMICMGLCTSDGTPGKPDVDAGGKRCDDRLYLFGNYRVCRDLCGGCGNCESA